MYYIQSDPHNLKVQHKEYFNNFEEAQNRAIDLSKEMCTDFGIYEYDSTSELFLLEITYMPPGPCFENGIYIGPKEYTIPF